MLVLLLTWVESYAFGTTEWKVVACDHFLSAKISIKLTKLGTQLLRIDLVAQAIIGGQLLLERWPQRKGLAIEEVVNVRQSITAMTGIDHEDTDHHQ